MRVIRTVAEMREAAREAGPSAFVPTMGALHEGHLSLIRRARELLDHVVVSNFVNPTQFGPGEDYSNYPRPVERDEELCRAAGVDVVFQPAVEEIYPPGEEALPVKVPAVGTDLEGRCRPGHFEGVCRVVPRLLDVVAPQVACFGLKDYQQLKVVEALVEELQSPVRIEACPTVRDPDGLALSSRNVHLAPEQRQVALALYVTLQEGTACLHGGELDGRILEEIMAKRLRDAGVDVEYAAVRGAARLEPLTHLGEVGEDMVLLVAGCVGGVHLIDNMVVTRHAAVVCGDQP